MGIDIGNAIKKPFDLMRENYDLFVPAILPFAVSLIAGVVFFGVIGIGFFSALSSVFSIITLMTLIGSFLALIIIEIIAFIVAGGAITYMVYRQLGGVKVTYKEGIDFALNRIGNLLLASLIISIGIVIGTILFVIPGLIVAFFTIFTLQEIIIANKSWDDAISGSIDIVKKNFSDVLVFAIILAIVAGLMNVVLSLIPIIGDAISVLILAPYITSAITIAYLSLNKYLIKIG